jgi:hypothetical protein
MKGSQEPETQRSPPGQSSVPVPLHSLGRQKPPWQLSSRSHALALDAADHRRVAAVDVVGAAGGAGPVLAGPEVVGALGVAAARMSLAAEGTDAHGLVGAVGVVATALLAAGAAVEAHLVEGADVALGDLAGVTLAVAVGVGLVGVRRGGAVVVGVGDAVFVGVDEVLAGTEAVAATDQALGARAVVTAGHDLDVGTHTVGADLVVAAVGVLGAGGLAVLAAAGSGEGAEGEEEHGDQE